MAQNGEHWMNLKRKPTQAGLCLTCFQEARERKGKQNFVSHHDLSKCE